MTVFTNCLPNWFAGHFGNWPLASRTKWQFAHVCVYSVLPASAFA